MILVAVIVGYILGIIPFIVPEILESKNKKIEINQGEKENKLQKEIFDEWLNGPKELAINQADIYNEYITGQESRKGV